MNENGNIGEGQGAIDGEGETGFLGTLPDDLRADPSLSGFKDVGDLAKSYVETKKMVGGSVRLPTPEAPAEEWDKFYAKIRPEKPEDYKITFSEEVKADDAAIDAFRGMAHKAGLSQAQVEAVAAFEDEHLKTTMQNFNEIRTKSMDGLKEEWGSNFEKNLEVANRALNDLAPETRDFLEVTGLDGHGSLFRLMHKVGLNMGEDSSHGDNKEGGGDPRREELAKIYADPKHAYWDVHNPGHKEAVEKTRRMNEEVYGTESALPGLSVVTSRE